MSTILVDLRVLTFKEKYYIMVVIKDNLWRIRLGSWMGVGVYQEFLCPWGYLYFFVFFIRVDIIVFGAFSTCSIIKSITLLL